MREDGLEQQTHAVAIAQAFVAARRDARGLPDYPGPIPAALAQAYAIQDEAIRVDGRPVVGWKVGRIMPPLDIQFGDNRLAGPIFAGTLATASPDPVVMPVFTAGFAAAEAEFLLRVGRAPDPTRTHWTLEEAAAHIDAVHVGIEIASSPFSGINALGPAVTISDYGNNNGLVIGSLVPDWKSRAFLDWPVALTLNGIEVGAATASTMLDGPFGAAAFLFGLAARRGIAIGQGQWISSGAVTGVHEVAPGAQVAAHFNDDSRLTVRCGIKAASAQ